MTEVAFHFNVPDRMGYACRLLRKAVRRGSRVVVSGPPAVLAALDRLLWTFDALEFVPHVHVRPGQPVAPRLRDTPVWLADHVQDAPHQDVLLNVGDAVIDGFESFARVIELVPAADGPSRVAGRSRWKHYTDRGYALKKHDVAQDAAA